MKATVIVNLQLTAIDDFEEHGIDLTAAAEEFARQLSEDTKDVFRLDDVTILTSKVFTHEGDDNDDDDSSR